MSADADPAIDAVTPVADADLDTTIGFRGLYIGGTGGAFHDVSVVTSKGNTRVFYGVPVGTVLPVRVKRVNSSLTTADVSLMLALY